MQLYFAKEFSPYPFGRDNGDGEFNGTKFRNLLREKFDQAQNKGETLEIVLDGVHGLGGAFLDEAFGEFAKNLKEEKNKKLSTKDLDFRADMPHYDFYIHKIWSCIEQHYQSTQREN